ncbi:dephospho-CoA kinase [Flavobacterium filum]|uniref:dephospho-CoA kinase n=1 Tax=Flavobacterium filum TaxID=370974 RepID=UPI00041E071B|nr:dephospho-CoA kinase [Flavobacterium filum]
MSKLIGLTGGIGSGKTTVAKMFAAKGIPVYIADEEAKKLMNTSKIIQAIENEFGKEVINNGKINRTFLAEKVFNNKEKLNDLNQIVHPAVKEDFKSWLKKNRDFPFVMKETAILFETGGNKDCDLVITVTAPLSERISRIISRDNTNEQSIKDRIKNQLDDDFKIKHSDYVIQNSTLESTENQVDEIVKALKKIQ